VAILSYHHTFHLAPETRNRGIQDGHLIFFPRRVICLHQTEQHLSVFRLVELGLSVTVLPHQNHLRTARSVLGEEGQVVQVVVYIEIPMFKVAFKGPPLWFHGLQKVRPELQRWDGLVRELGQASSRSQVWRRAGTSADVFHGSKRTMAQGASQRDRPLRVDCAADAGHKSSEA